MSADDAIEVGRIEALVANLPAAYHDAYAKILDKSRGSSSLRNYDPFIPQDFAVCSGLDSKCCSCRGFRSKLCGVCMHVDDEDAFCTSCKAVVAAMDRAKRETFYEKHSRMGIAYSTTGYSEAVEQQFRSIGQQSARERETVQDMIASCVDLGKRFLLPSADADVDADVDVQQQQHKNKKPKPADKTSPLSMQAAVSRTHKSILSKLQQRRIAHVNKTARKKLALQAPQAVPLAPTAITDVLNAAMRDEAPALLLFIAQFMDEVVRPVPLGTKKPCEHVLLQALLNTGAFNAYTPNRQTPVVAVGDVVTALKAFYWWDTINSVCRFKMPANDKFREGWWRTLRDADGESVVRTAAAAGADAQPRTQYKITTYWKLHCKGGRY